MLLAKAISTEQVREGPTTKRITIQTGLMTAIAKHLSLESQEGAAVAFSVRPGLKALLPTKIESAKG